MTFLRLITFESESLFIVLQLQINDAVINLFLIKFVAYNMAKKCLQFTQNSKPMELSYG